MRWALFKGFYVRWMRGLLVYDYSISPHYDEYLNCSCKIVAMKTKHQPNEFPMHTIMSM
jgi:hypothetical protein